jgi:hypothetical protein
LAPAKLCHLHADEGGKLVGGVEGVQDCFLSARF